MGGGAPDPSGEFSGYVALVCAAFCYGSYFVPAKQFEIYDGIVYQWYQCSGIMLSGLAIALLRNDWGGTAESRGFYVAPEGLLSGLIFQLANILSTLSVKAVGLGNYYTIHQVSNLGGAFVIGVWGPDLGIPSTPPKSVALAAAGVLFVFLGMVPVMFMEPERQQGSEGSEAPAGAPEPAEPEPASEGRRPCPKPKTESVAAFAGRLTERLAPVAPEADRVEEGALEEQVSAKAAGILGKAGEMLDVLHLWPRKWAADDLARSLLERDHRRGDPHLNFGMEALIVQEDPFTPGPSPAPGAWRRRFSTPARFMRDRPPPIEEGSRRAAAAGEAADVGRWLKGAALSLLAGAIYAMMYVPLLPWKQRMLDEGLAVSGFDSFFSICAGLYAASTCWLFAGGAMQKYRGRRLEKSVLLPAVLSGVIYACAACTYLYAMMILPYAVAYALCCGGGLAVSLLWGVLYFGESSSPHNRRCVLSSFAGIFVGIVLLGMSNS